MLVGFLSEKNTRNSDSFRMKDSDSLTGSEVKVCGLLMESHGPLARPNRSRVGGCRFCFLRKHGSFIINRTKGCWDGGVAQLVECLSAIT